MATANLEAYRQARHRLFAWRFEQPWVTKALLALGFAAITGITARVELFVPWTPVPYTLQVFWVLLSAVLLGRGWGAFSLTAYVGLGAAGAPWFRGGAAGAAHLAGITGGYIIGFILAAAVVGYLTDSYVRARRLPALVPIMLLGVAVIYACGAAWLSVVLDVGAMEAVRLGVLPFVPADVAKAVVAAGAAAAVVPRAPFGPERDA